MAFEIRPFCAPVSSMVPDACSGICIGSNLGSLRSDALAKVSNRDMLEYPILFLASKTM